MAIKAVRDNAVTDYRMLIDGAPATSVSGDWTEVRSPATGELSEAEKGWHYTIFGDKPV